MIRSTAAILVLGIGLGGCGQSSGPGHPDRAISPNLDSGVTSSDGGGQRTLHDLDTQSIGPNGLQHQTSSGQERAY